MNISGNIHVVTNKTPSRFASAVNATFAEKTDKPVTDKSTANNAGNKNDKKDMFNLSELATTLKASGVESVSYNAKDIKLSTILEKSVMKDIEDEPENGQPEKKVSDEISKQLDIIKEEQKNKINILEDETNVDILEEIEDPEMADYIDEIIEIGKKHEKPEDMNDFQWGMLVKLGETMGLNDPDVISSLTDSDAAAYIQEFLERGKYETAEAFWKDRFLTDENGDFIKIDGKVVHNPEKPIHGTLIRLDNAEEKYYFPMNHSETGEPPTKLIKVRPEALMNLDSLIADGKGNFFHAFTHISGSENQGLNFTTDNYEDTSSVLARKGRVELAQKLRFYQSLVGGSKSKSSSDYNDLNSKIAEIVREEMEEKMQRYQELFINKETDHPYFKTTQVAVDYEPFDLIV